MTPRAKLTVTTGPDRGKEFDVADELIHIGRGGENQIVLSDPTVEELHASMVCRNGRFAIYALVEDLEVDGNKVPTEQWVWLPAEAHINFSRRTGVRFVAEGGSEPSAAIPASPPIAMATAKTVETPALRRDPEPRTAVGAATAAAATAAAATVTAAGMGSTSGTGTAVLPRPKPVGEPTDSTADIPKPKKGAKADKKTARFITDGPGDPLVKLGDDGHLPELQLLEGKARDAREQKGKQTNPLVMVAVLVFSFSFSILMLFIDVEQFGTGSQNRGDARQEIREYYGGENDVLKPYQLHLRQARQAFSRRDFKTEQHEYRVVLDLLYAEGKSKFTGLTGSIESDEKLKNLIAAILSP